MARLNVTAYYADTSGLQTPSAFVRPNGTIAFITRNFADYENYGIEAELTLAPADGLNIFASLGWQDDQYNMTNVPDYPKLAQLWWQNIGDAMSGAKTPQQALDALCADQEKVMERLERAGVQGDIGPKLNEPRDPAEWLAEPGSPKAKLANEDEDPKTVAYDDLIASWQ